VGTEAIKEDEDEASFLGALGRGFYVRAEGEKLSCGEAFRGRRVDMRGGRGRLARARELCVVRGGRLGMQGDLEAGSGARAESWVPRVGRFYVCSRGRDQVRMTLTSATPALPSRKILESPAFSKAC
jgi:hypothetical protein